MIVFYTKSLKDDSPTGHIHSYTSGNKTDCDKNISGPRWLICHGGFEITCKKCKQEKMLKIKKKSIL